MPARAQVGLRPAADPAFDQPARAAVQAAPDTASPLPVVRGLRPLELAAAASGVSIAAMPDPAHPADPARRAPQSPGARALAARNALAIGGGVTGVALYGFAKWWDEGFNRRADFEREGWFGRGTRYGGIDKVGHAYSSYVGVRLLAPLLEALGNEPGAAQRLAFWSTLGTFAGIEVLDAYSKQYRASAEDLVANAAGAAVGLAVLGRPQLDALLDWRLAYRRSGRGDWDPAGDYEGQAYLLVLKAEGIDRLRDHPVGRYLELSVGYAARGFDVPAGQRRRELQVGLSLNLSRVLADAAYGGQRGATRMQRVADLAFELVQIAPRAYAKVGLD